MRLLPDGVYRCPACGAEVTPVSAGPTTWKSPEHTDAYWCGWLDSRYGEPACFTGNRRLAKWENPSDRLEYYRGHRAGREAAAKPGFERAGSSKPRRPEGPGNHAPPELMKGGMGEKVCLITGATSGIGKATAMGLANMGASVVMVGRDRDRGEAALADIKEKSANASVDLMLADVSSQEQIRRLADDFKEAYPRLDVLINNAGVIRSERITTADGLETTFAVNHLAYSLLTNLLLDVLKASAPSRIVNVASGEQRNGTIDFDDLQGEKGYKGAKAYSQSKLATVLFTYELARRLEGTGVTANCLHPGVVGTNLGSGVSGASGSW
jgi:NAD(P)-dependent dehydrogenase (short-subunit alcohol dehydrogenase family)